MSLFNSHHSSVTVDDILKEKCKSDMVWNFLGNYRPIKLSCKTTSWAETCIIQVKMTGWLQMFKKQLFILGM